MIPATKLIQLLLRARTILANMALEEMPPPRWWEFWKPRWAISDEPLRGDAAHLVKEINKAFL